MKHNYLLYNWMFLHFVSRISN